MGIETELLTVSLKQSIFQPKGTPTYTSGEPIERVEEFKYIGPLIAAKGGATSEIQGRISKAWSVFGQLC